MLDEFLEPVNKLERNSQNMEFQDRSPMRKVLEKQHSALSQHSHGGRLSIKSQTSFHGNYDHEKFKEDQNEGKKVETKVSQWILPAIGAACCFVLGNSTISIITSHVDGLACIFYLSFGAWVTGLVFQTIMSIRNYKSADKDYIWHRNNIIIDGKVNVRHLLLFLIMCCIFFGIMSSIFMTMYFSHLSGVNVGVITTIWSVQPLIAAVVDYLIYRQMLGFNHFVGMILVVLGAVSIGYSGI